MAVAKLNSLRIVPGTDFEVTLNILGPDNTPSTLVGAAVSTATIGKWPGSDRQYNFITTLTTESGQLKLELPRDITTQLELGRNYYNVQLIQSNNVFRVLEGTIIVEK
jgi:hypothetical protein